MLKPELQEEKNYLMEGYLFKQRNREYKEAIAEAVIALEELSGRKLDIKNNRLNLTYLDDIKTKRILYKKSEGTFRVIVDKEDENKIDSMEIYLKEGKDELDKIKTLRHELVHLLSQDLYGTEKENGLSIKRRYIDEIMTEMYAKKIGEYLGDDEISIKNRVYKKEDLTFKKVDGGYSSIVGYAYMLNALFENELFTEKFTHVECLEDFNPYLYTLNGYLRDTFEHPNKDNFKKLSKQIMVIATEFVDSYNTSQKSKRELYEKYMNFREEALKYGTPQYIERDLARIDKEFAKKIIGKDSFTIEEEGKILNIINSGKDENYETFIQKTKIPITEKINIKIGNKTYITEDIKESKIYDKTIKKAESFEELLSLPAVSLKDIKNNKEDFPSYISATARIKEGLSTEETLNEIIKAINNENKELHYGEDSLYNQNNFPCDKDGRNILYPLAVTNLNDINFYYKVYDNFIENDIIDMGKILNHIEQVDNFGKDIFDYALEAENVSFLAETLNQLAFFGENINDFLVKHTDSINNKPEVFFDTIEMLSEHRLQTLENIAEQIRETPKEQKFSLKDIKNKKEQNIGLYFDQSGYGIYSHGKDLGNLNDKFKTKDEVETYLFDREVILRNIFAENGMYITDKDKFEISSWEYFLTLRDFTEEATKGMLYEHLSTFPHIETSFNNVSYNKIKNNPEMFGALADIMGENINALKVDVNGIKVPMISAIFYDKDEQSIDVAKQIIPYFTESQKELLADNANLILEDLGNKEMFKIFIESDINVFKEGPNGYSPFDKFINESKSKEILALTFIKTNSGKTLKNLLDERIENKEKREAIKNYINDLSFGTFLDKD